MARNRLQFRVSVKDDASANLQRISKETDKLAGSFKRLAATAISIASISEIARLADTYRLLQNRLRLVTKDSVELKAVTQELVKVSIRSRTSFQSTADLYARVARSSRELGLSQQELIDFTETVSKSIRISGSTSQEAAAGVIQFGQALASSRLSGDELRSVLEQMPRLAQAIAEGMGVGIGQLRELGEMGELTAVKVLDALRTAGPEIQAEFAKLIPLVSEAFTNLNTAIVSTVGRFDEVQGTSVAVASALLDVADQVILLGDALTGELTKEGLENISSTAQATAVALLTVAFALGAIKDGLDLSLGSAGKLAVNLTSQLADVGPGALFRPGDVKDALVRAWEDTLDDVEGSIEDSNKQILSDYAGFVETLNALFGGIFTPVDVDLEGSDDPKGGLNKNQRDAQRRAVLQLQKMKTTILQQQLAFEIASAEGRDFATVLAEVKIRAAATAAGLVDMGENVVQLNRNLELKQNWLEDDAALVAIKEELHFLGASEKAQFVHLRLLELSSDASHDVITAYSIAAEKIFDMTEKLKESQSFMEKLSLRAAQNIQDAFADFLFDPFEEGIKGMLKGFIDVIRRMLAEMLAFQILTSIPGLGTFFTKGLSGKAAGGPVIAGQPVLVGERGPELFIPHASGSIKNNTAMGASGGGAQFITHIDARGADPGLIARFPSIMEQRDKQLLLKVKQLVETGGVTI